MTGFLTIQNAQIGYKNFAGDTSMDPFAKSGFFVLLDFEDVERLTNDGWTVKYIEPNRPYLKVFVNFECLYTTIKIIDSETRQISKEELNELDSLDFQNADLVIAPMRWRFNNKEGKSALLVSMDIRRSTL